jgi:hypothetical protein
VIAPGVVQNTWSYVFRRMPTAEVPSIREPPQRGGPRVFTRSRNQIGALRRVREMEGDGGALRQNLPVREQQRRDLRERVHRPEPLVRRGRFKKIVQVLDLIGKAIPGELRLDQR